jgi:ketopantoate reductase
MTIKSIDTQIHSLKTSCCYSGSLLDDTQELMILSTKEKLVKKALKQYSTISPCGTKCFQVKNKELLFWFNFDKTTKLMTEDLGVQLF